jgi:peptide/nickel transport system substrate-binding protein
MNGTKKTRCSKGLSALVRSGLVAAALLFGLAGPGHAATYFKIGLLGEPKDLNPFGASDAWTGRVTRLLFQPLYMVDPMSQALIPWLAEAEPLYDPQGKTVTFRLREMKWDDGSDFSAEDVVFTVHMIKRFRIPRYFAYWEFVEKVEAVDPRTVRLTLEKPTPIFAGRTLTTWVVQKKKWSRVLDAAEGRLKDVQGETMGGPEDDDVESAAHDALKIIQGRSVPDPIGLGPFRFKEWKKGAYILLEKNPHFFGQGKEIAGRKLGPFLDGVLFKIYDNLGSASVALKEGEIDFLWKGVSHSLISGMIQDPKIQVPMALDSGYRFLGFNLRKPPMSDPAFRRAVAYLVDKDFIINRILHNHGEPLNTFVPPNNTFYFNAATPLYGQGMDQERRIKEAYRLLSASGYGWKMPPVAPDGSIRKGSGLSMPGGDPVPAMTILSPTADYDTEMAASGQMIARWLQDFGLRANWEPVAFGGLLQKVRNERDFDLFIMGWRNLSLDPDYLRRFFHSTYDAPNQWNYTGYHNEELDRLAEMQAQALDSRERRDLVFKLQERLASDLPIIPLYVPHVMEGIRTDRFEGWTKGASGVGNIWTFCLLKPKR